MPDWTKSMEQSYEYYIVDPYSWRDTTPIRYVISSSVERDMEAGTLGSATISVADPVGEYYIRIYLVTIQNGIKERHPLGTFLIQTPSVEFDGKVKAISADAYTPLLELKENPPPIGYSVRKGENIMETAYMITREHVRAPVVKPSNNTLLYDDFVANTDDTWLTFLSDFIANAKYTFSLDEMGRILFAPKQEIEALRPVWTYTDDNSSILLPAMTMTEDLYNIPNVVEVVYSDSTAFFYAKAVNDDSNSPTSTVSRGREITRRFTNPSGIGNPTEDQIQVYAEKLLKELSTIEYKITYTHGYCPVRLGDCVRIKHSRAGIEESKGRVIKQQIDCVSGCTVTETAIFTKKLWR